MALPDDDMHRSSELLRRVPPAPRPIPPRAGALVFRTEGGWVACGIMSFLVLSLLLPGLPLLLALPRELSRAVVGVRTTGGWSLSGLGHAGLLFLLVPAFFAHAAVRFRRFLRRTRRAFVHGTPVLARVISSGPDVHLRVNRVPRHKLVWTYEAEGQTYSGHLTGLTPEREGDLLQARAVPVLYLPEDPRTHVLYVT